MSKKKKEYMYAVVDLQGKTVWHGEDREAAHVVAGNYHAAQVQKWERSADEDQD